MTVAIPINTNIGRERSHLLAVLMFGVGIFTLTGVGFGTAFADYDGTEHPWNHTHEVSFEWHTAPMVETDSSYGIRYQKQFYVNVNPPFHISNGFVNFRITDGGATYGEDYILFLPNKAGSNDTKVLRLPVGEGRVPFVVSVYNDFLNDDSEVFTLSLESSDYGPFYIIGDIDEMEFQIYDYLWDRGSGNYTLTGWNTADPNRGMHIQPDKITLPIGGNASYGISLASAPSHPVVVEAFRDVNGKAHNLGKSFSGMRVSPSLLNFTVDNWSTPQTFTVTAGNSAPDRYIIIHGLTSLDSDYDSIRYFNGPGIIGRTHVVIDVAANSAPPAGQEVGDSLRFPTSMTLSLDPASVSEGAGTTTVTATLDAPAPPDGVEVGVYASSGGNATDGVDYSIPAAGIAISGGQQSGSASITITDDSLDETNEQGVISALADVFGQSMTDTATLIILDDDTAGVSIAAASPLALSEGGNATYTVVLDSRPTANVTISASSSDGGAASVSPASHTFEPSGWNTPLAFTVSGVADDDTTDERVSITHAVTSDDALYAAVLLATIQATVADTTEEQLQGQDNRAPTVSAAIDDVTIPYEGGAQTISLSGVFDDADNDSLNITAASSDTTKAGVTVASDGSSLTVTGKARGISTITVTADDGSDGTVSDAFAVTVKAAPTISSAISDMSGLDVGDSQDVSLSGMFDDADNDSLNITAASSDYTIAEAIIFQDTLTIIAVANGSATIMVTAQDVDGNQVSDTFDVTVGTTQQQEPQNQAPTVSAAIDDVTIPYEGGAQTISLSGVFSDADNDSLNITAASSDTTKADVTVASDGSSLTVTGKARGTVTITVTADDGNGGTISDAFAVTVKAAPEVSSAISDMAGLITGDSHDVSLSGVFDDADGDSLTVSVTSSNGTVATATTDGSSLTVTAQALGVATITVTAQDADGNQVSDTFEVAVAAAQQQPVQAADTPELDPIVAQYDTDGSGAIEQDEWVMAKEDYANGKLTNEEIFAISKARV